MSIPREDPRPWPGVEAGSELDDPLESDDEGLRAVIAWCAVFMVIAVGTVLLGLNHRP